MSIIKAQRSLQNSKSSHRVSIKSSKTEPPSLENIYEEPDAKPVKSSFIRGIPTVNLKPKNARDELVLIFFSSMLDYIVESSYIVPEKSYISMTYSDGTLASEICIKDFKTISDKDVVCSEVIGVNGSSVSLTTKTKKTRTSSRKLIISLSDFDRPPSKSKSVTSGPSNSSLAYSSGPRLLGSSSLGFIKEMVYPIPSSPFKRNVFELEQNLRVRFRNGNEYEGKCINKLMHGRGIFYWADGTIYRGDFENGAVTGKGTMRFNDLSWYEGAFCNGYREGDGVMNVKRTPLIYNGGWRAGKFHGTGWLLYDTNNWYEGEWKDGEKCGKGMRQYVTGGKYKGEWKDDMRDGVGSMLWNNNDVRAFNLW